MKLNMKAPIIGFDGVPLEQDFTAADGKKQKRPVVLRDIIITALNTPGPRYMEETPEEKFKRGFLCIEAHTKDEIDVSAEEAAMMKRCVAAGYAPLLVYRAHLALDGKDMNPESTPEPGRD